MRQSTATRAREGGDRGERVVFDGVEWRRGGRGRSLAHRWSFIPDVRTRKDKVTALFFLLVDDGRIRHGRRRQRGFCGVLVCCRGASDILNFSVYSCFASRRARWNDATTAATQILQFYDVRVGETERNRYTRVSGGVSSCQCQQPRRTSHTTTHNSYNASTY